MLDEVTDEILDILTAMVGKLRGEEPPTDRFDIRVGRRVAIEAATRRVECRSPSPLGGPPVSDRIRVALIFGGQSSEHGISCLTASGVLKAIDRGRFDVVGVGISRNGRWTQVPLEVIAGYRIVDGKVPEVADPEHDAVWMVGEHGCEVATRSGETLVDIHGVDVAFALLHGPFGEDGTIQGLFEMMGIRYVGSGVTASAIGMDKHFMKVAFEAAGLPVWPYVAASGHRLRHDRAAVVREINENLTYPLFVKPARGGSSIGISRVSDPSNSTRPSPRPRSTTPRSSWSRASSAPANSSAPSSATPSPRWAATPR